ncbi:MAG: DUF1700 domain-containing protein [Clostridia bacterium]|nr:DUF1700 domain-containing protein [Clostridia bacterium]
MRKQEFLCALKKRLSGLPKQDVEERLNFYSEMIDDRTEEGLTEEEAISDIGSVDEISAQIIAGIPLAKIATERVKPKKRLKMWEIVLLLLGSPIWLSLAIAAFAVILSLYVVLWSLIVSVWAVFASLIGCAIGGVIAGIFFALSGNGLTGIAMVGAGIVCAGLAIFLFFGCKAATKGIIHLTKKIALGIKKCFIKKENA